MHLINADNFEQFVSQNADRLSLVHFHAHWNPLDDRMCRVTDEVEAAVGDQLGLGRAEVSDPSNEPLIDYVGLTHVPALFFIFRHRVVDYKVGYSKVRLVGHVQQLLQQYSPYSQDPPVPINPGPFPSGIVLAPVQEQPMTPSSHDRNVNAPFGAPGMHGGSAFPLPNAGNSQGNIGQAAHDRWTPDRRNPGFDMASQAIPNRPLYGLIPHQLAQETPKKSWWSRFLG